MLALARRTRRVVALPIIALVLVLGQMALAATVTIDAVDLEGVGALWDPEAGYGYGLGGAPCLGGSDAVGYAGAVDGALGERPDAFDGGLYLWVGARLYDDRDGLGNRVGQRLMTGPEKTGRLIVTRTDEALGSSPTLRTLVKLRNPADERVTVPIAWDSALGGDERAATRGSSTSPVRATTGADRWTVVSDARSDDGLVDPVVTFVVYGPGRHRTTDRQVPLAPEGLRDSELQGCIAFRFEVSVPAGQTRYLLFFTEMRETNTLAIDRAPRFMRATPGRGVLEGIGLPIARRILNWDFTR